MSADTRTPMNTNTLTDADFEASTDKAGLAAGVICSSFKVFMADQGIEWNDEFVKPAATALINMVVKAELAAKVEELAKLKDALVYAATGHEPSNGELAYVVATKEEWERLTAQTAAAEGLAKDLHVAQDALADETSRAEGLIDAVQSWVNRARMGEAGKGFFVTPDDMGDLVKAIGQASPSPWRDVASAPRDGTRVLLYGPNPSRRVIGCWDDAVNQWLCPLDFDWTPTHWMPLPAPPTPQQSNKP